MKSYTIDLKQSEMTPEEKKNWKRYRVSIQIANFIDNPIVTAPTKAEAVKTALVHTIMKGYFGEDQKDLDTGLKMEVINIMEIESNKSYVDPNSGIGFIIDFGE